MIDGGYFVGYSDTWSEVCYIILTRILAVNNVINRKMEPPLSEMVSRRQLLLQRCRGSRCASRVVEAHLDLVVLR